MEVKFQFGTRNRLRDDGLARILDSSRTVDAFRYSITDAGRVALTMARIDAEASSEALGGRVDYLPVGSVWQYVGSGRDKGPIYVRREDGRYESIGDDKIPGGLLMESPRTPLEYPLEFRRREDLEQMVARGTRYGASVAGWGVFAYAVRVVVSDFVRRRALPEWLPDECVIDIVRNGPYTVATCVGTDGVRRVGCSRKHPEDAEDQFVGARYAVGRLLGQE